MEPMRILVVDSHPIIADSLALLLAHRSSYTTHACSTYTDVPAYAASFKPHIIMVNLHQDTITEGLHACRMCNTISEEQTVVLLATRYMVENEPLLLDAVEAGAAGVLIREELNHSQLITALKELGAGRSLINLHQLRKALAARHIEALACTSTANAVESLTAREQEIANHIAAGASTSSIAAQLNISGRTVQTHVSSILAKLGVRTRVEAVVHLYRLR